MRLLNLIIYLIVNLSYLMFFFILQLLKFFVLKAQNCEIETCNWEEKSQLW